MSIQVDRSSNSTTKPLLPTGWCWATVDEVIELCQYGSSAKTTEDPSGVPVLRMGNIQDGRLDLTQLKYLPYDHDEFPKLHLREGDLLFNRTNSAELVGKSAIYLGVPSPSSYASYLVALRLGAACVSKLLCFYLNSSFGRLWVRSVVSQQVGQANVNSTKLRALRFPLPPLNEQHRIVAKIEELISELDAGVAALKRAKANLKRYRTAVLKAAVEGKLTQQWRAEHPTAEPASKLLARILTARRQKWEADHLAKFAASGKEPTKNWQTKYVEPEQPKLSDLPSLPESWTWATLDQLLTYLRNGYFQSPSGAETGTPILRINAVRPLSVDLAEARFLDNIEGCVDDFFIENGDLLFTRYNGSVDLLGVAGLVRGCTESILHPDKLVRVKLVLGEPLPSYIEIAANVNDSRKHMVGRARTTAGQTGISGPDIREMPVPLPPLDEQTCINLEVAEKLSLIDAAETAIERGLLRAARLRQSILKQAFEGKLVAQDPQDEPASTLLSKLKEVKTEIGVADSAAPRQNGRKRKGGVR